MDLEFNKVPVLSITNETWNDFYSNLRVGTLYTFWVNLSANTPFDMPETNTRYMLFVIRQTTTYGKVIAFPADKNGIPYQKSCNNGVWSAWGRLVDTTSIETAISTLQDDVDDIKSKTNYIYKYDINDQTGFDLLFNNNYSDVDIENCTIYVSNGTVQIKMWGLMNNSKTGSVTNPANIRFPMLNFFKPVETVKSCGFTTGATTRATVNTLHPTSGLCEVYYDANIGQGDQLGVMFTYISKDATDLETYVDPTLGNYKTTLT